MILYRLDVIVFKVVSIGCCIPLHANLPPLQQFPGLIMCECFQQLYSLLNAVYVTKNFFGIFSLILQEINVHTLTYLLTYILTYLLTYLRTYLLTYSLTYLLTYSLTYLLTYVLTYLLQFSCHSVAVVLTLVQTKQIRMNILVHKRNNTKTQYKQYKTQYIPVVT